MESNRVGKPGELPKFLPRKVAISALMRAEGSGVCLQWAEEPDIIGSCQRCVVLADPLDRDVIRETLEETKGPMSKQQRDRGS